MAAILVPIPAQDFDPTEVAIPWQVLTGLGHAVAFATPDGKPGQADDIMLSGQGLDIWGSIPGLRRLPAIGLVLRAKRDARAAYQAMQRSREFRTPLRWDAIDADTYDALVLPGGHRARGMRAYLESETLHTVVAAFFEAGKPVGAICHGVLLAARSRRAGTALSVLHGRRTTALTWALERSAWSLTRITRFWDPDYYRTYADAPGTPAGWMSVQSEVTRALAKPEDFQDVPRSDPDWRRKTSGMARDSATDASPAFVVQDGNYVSARWPGDAHGFARTFAALLDDQAPKATPSFKTSAVAAPR